MAEEFHQVRVLEVRQEGRSLRAITVDPGTNGLAHSHRVPGQYVRARLPGHSKEAFFALANAPGAERLELLIKAGAEGNGLADSLALLKAGEALEITAPAGKGFPLEGERGRDLWLFAGGSGISAIRSAVEWVSGRRGEYGRAVLLFGARTRQDLAYQSLFERWEAARIEVEPVLSRPEDASWTGRVGHVQHAIEHLGGVEAGRSSAFLAGGKEFMAAVTGALHALGMPPERIFRNF